MYRKLFNLCDILNVVVCCTDSLFVYFRFGEAGDPLCTGQEGGNQDCKQGETQWKRTAKGNQASNQLLIIP